MANKRYYQDNKLEAIQEKFENSICKNCFETVKEFDRQLELNDYSVSRRLKYWYSLKLIHNLLEVCFNEAKRENIENFIMNLKNRDYAPRTEADHKTNLRFFYRWLLENRLDGDYPSLVKWVRTSIKQSEKKEPQILTQEEIEEMANSTNNVRDKAGILSLYETGCRIGEFLDIRFNDIEETENGYRIQVHGKTGTRRVMVIEYFKELRAWIDSHPVGEGNVWVNINMNNNQMSPRTFNQVLKRASRNAEIGKRVYPHIMRHSRATHLSIDMSEAVLRKYFGWSKSSRTPAIYQHLNTEDVEKVLLENNGINGKKICKKCEALNPPVNEFCGNCKTPLELENMIKIHEKEREFFSLVKEFFMYYAERNEEFKEVFKGFVEEKDNKGIFQEN